jgi:hypothetical protein
MKISFESIVTALCILKANSDDEGVYMDMLSLLDPYTILDEGQEAFLNSSLALFGLSSLD